MKKRERFPHVSEEQALNDPENEVLFSKEEAFIGKFDRIIKDVCNKINIDFKIIIVALEYLWKHYIPNDNEISNFPSFNTIKKTFSGFFGDDHVYITISRFIKIL